MYSLRLALTLLVAAGPLALLGCDAAGPSSTVPVAGTILNSYGRPVSGATVLLNSADGQDGATTTTDVEGRYSASVPAGTYSLGVTARGYTPGAMTMAVGEGGAADADHSLIGPAKLEGQIINAATGLGQPDVTLQCARQNEDGSYPDPRAAYDFSTVSDADGNLHALSVPYGASRCHASGPGFDPRTFDIHLLRDEATLIPPVVIVPPPPEGALRVVLTWGQNPSDLDSHLTGPDGSGGRFHVYYVNRSFGLTNLDVDDTSSFGPETVTLFPTGEGTYRYSVFNFSNQGNGGAQAIAASPARVEVHDHEGFVCAYVPEATGLDGNTWRVFEATAETAGGEPAMVAPCARGAEGLPGLGYVMAAGSSDDGTFLVLPPKAGVD